MLATAVSIELLGIATVGAGVGMEVAAGGPTYLVVITVGSVLVAAGGILFGKFFRIWR